MKNDEPFNSNPNKEYIRSAVDTPVIEAWFRRLGRPLKYLGLPAWQMLDIVAWQQMLGRFTGIERAENQQHLMFLNANVKDLEHRLHGLYGSFDDILLRGRDAYQKSPDWPYDLINLDYFGGFLYSDLSRPKAFRKMVANQAAYEQSFILIVTQHLRDGDTLKEKDKFLADLGMRLKGAALDSKLHAEIDGVVSWYRNADIPDAARQGLYMNFLCREFGEFEHFSVRCRPGIVYAGTGDSWMIHFVTDFVYQPSIAHSTISEQSLVEVINLGLLEARDGRLVDKAFQQPKLGSGGGLTPAASK
ncbi:MAG TPA: hypothetical protein VIY49_20755 [Bryobacteraceae bacterium]